MYMIKWIKLFQGLLKFFFVDKTRQHLYNTTGSSLGVPQVKTTTYGSNSFTLHAIRTWNFSQNKHSITTSLPNLTTTKFLKVIKTCISEKAKIPQNFKVSKLWAFLFQWKLATSIRLSNITYSNPRTTYPTMPN